MVYWFYVNFDVLTQYEGDNTFQFLEPISSKTMKCQQTIYKLNSSQLNYHLVDSIRQYSS